MVTRLLLIVLVVVLTGGHVAMLQMVAWGGMPIERIQTAPTITSALISTFDGTQPCRMCRAVRTLVHDGQAQHSDQQAPAKPTKSLTDVKKIDAMVPLVLVLTSTPTGDDVVMPASQVVRGCIQSAPEPPPPRLS